MPVYIAIKSYLWLQKIGVFRMDPIKLKTSSQLCEIPFDEQIYLQNGYLIGVAIRKFVKTYSKQYQELLKIRKLATLQEAQNQNWQIIQPYLTRIGCNAIEGYNDSQQEVQISLARIAQILEALYLQYGPKQQQKLKLLKRIKYNYIDVYNFNPDKEPKQCQNSLQLFCNILVRTFNINLNQALGLLINKQKYLKKLIIQGSKIDQYDSVKKFYEQLNILWPVLEQFTMGTSNDIDKVLEAVSEGVFSDNSSILHQTLNLLSQVKNQEWFIKAGYYKLLRSNYIQCFYFTLQKLSPHYQKVLNTNLHTKLQNKMQLFTLLHNLIKTLPKTIYSKEIFKEMPLSYFYQQCFSVLNPQQIDNQPPKIVIRALQLLTKLITVHPQKIPHTYLSQIMQTFRFSINRNYCDTYHILALLFEILQSLMNKQSQYIQIFFKIVMKYVSSTFGQTRHWIIQNIKYLYEKMKKSFPLGCLLVMYSLDSIGQSDQYQLFDKIANDNTQLTLQQSTLALSYVTKYVQTQLHCKCFIQILKKFLKNHNKMTYSWAEQQCTHLIQKMHKINIPMFSEGQVNILNPKPPIKNKVINSIGLKRKQMLKFRQYQLHKQLLYLITNVRDKKFLGFYLTTLNHVINNLQKQIGIKRKQLLNLLKKLRIKVKKLFQQTKQPQTIDQITKSILMSRSQLSKTLPLQQRQSSFGQLSESKLLDQYEPLTGRVQDSIIYQQQYQAQAESQRQKRKQLQNQSKNQFLNSGHNKQLNEKINKYDEEEQLNKDKDKQIQIIKQFTQKQQQQNDFLIINNNMLQQNQIAYINATKQKYQIIIQHCTQVYKNYQKVLKTNLANKFSKNTHNSNNDVKNIISELGLRNLIQPNKFLQLLQKLTTSQPNKQPKQIVQDSLINIAFNIFDFKRNRRVSVSCVSSLFVNIDEKLKDDSIAYRTLLTGQSSPTHGKPPRNKFDKYLLTKNILFENKLSNNISKTSPKIKAKNYFQCFQILSNIFEKSFGIGLLQPLSKQVNNFGSPTAQLSNTIDLNIKVTNSSKDLQKGTPSNSYKSLTKLQQKSQLQYLQEQLQHLQDKDLLYDNIKNLNTKKYSTKSKIGGNKNSNSNNSNKIRLNFKEKKLQESFKFNKIQDQAAEKLRQKQKGQKASGSNIFVDNIQLKDKLSKRVKLLSQQLKSNKNQSFIKNSTPKQVTVKQQQQIKIPEQQQQNEQQK